jgi:hypothetical protein
VHFRIFGYTKRIGSSLLNIMVDGSIRLIIDWRWFCIFDAFVGYNDGMRVRSMRRASSMKPVIELKTARPYMSRPCGKGRMPKGRFLPFKGGTCALLWGPPKEGLEEEQGGGV